MLKERINFLCEKREISRKELVRGLITVPHLSNILSGRYLLADDLAASFAERLNVSADYLLKASDISDAQLKKLDEQVNAVILDAGNDDQLLNSIPEKEDSLITEFTNNLLRACLYQKRNDSVNYQRLLDEYLNFYLSELKKLPFEDFPLPLQKAYFYFFEEYNRGVGQNELALDYLNSLLPLVEKPLKIYLAVQTSHVDLLVKLRQLDEANQLTENLFRRVQTAGDMKEMTALYILKSGIYFNLHLYQEALISLAKAEENLVHIKEPNNYFTVIVNNRIIMLLKLEKINEAENELIRLEEAYVNAGHKDNPEVKSYLMLYTCEIAFTAKEWPKLENLLQMTEKLTLTPQQRETTNFYNAHLLWHQKKVEKAEKIALQAVEFFSKENQQLQVLSLLEILADISEQRKKYKQANKYNKQIISILKML